MDALHGIEEGGDEDDDMGVGESAEQCRARYMDAEQGEVSNPDEWAELHYGHLDQDNYDRMTAFFRANRQRLINARARAIPQCCSSWKLGGSSKLCASNR